MIVVDGYRRRSPDELARDRDAKATARRIAETENPDPTFEQFVERVRSARANGEHCIEMTVARGTHRSSATTVYMMFSDRPDRGPKSSTDYKIERLGTYTLRARWLVQDCVLWLRNHR